MLLGVRLMVGPQTLNLIVPVRIQHPHPNKVDKVDKVDKEFEQQLTS